MCQLNTVRNYVSDFNLPHLLAIDSCQNVNKYAKELHLSDSYLSNLSPEHSCVVFRPVRCKEGHLAGLNKIKFTTKTRNT